MASDHSITSSDGRRNGLPNPDPADLIKLLCRGLSRLAVAAQGIDDQLDEHLGRLRQILRSDISRTPELAAVIHAIDDRIKHVDEEREQRIDALQQAMEQLAGQLLALKPERPLARQLKTFLKDLGSQLGDGEELALLNRLSSLQGEVLAGGPREAGGLFSRWFGAERRGEAGSSERLHRLESESEAPSFDAIAHDAPPAGFTTLSPGPQTFSPEPQTLSPESQARSPEPQTLHPEPLAAVAISVEEPVALAVESPLETGAIALAMPAESVALVEPAPALVSEDPPFSRISTAVCAVLSELLRQIDPPPIAADNHQRVRERIGTGLNWYELVSVLEETSLVVLAALDRDRATFQQFLLELNHRLADAHLALNSSLQTNAERRQADTTLGDTVRDQVAEIQARVMAAAELDQLKSEVSTRLDSIVSAMDHHQHEESSRQQALEQQLMLLTERVRDMEAQSAQVEARFEEQRRLALIDMLTQMPNRQAYEERLQQEYQRWQRYQRPLALVVCDVDNFKSINDNFGHSAGDKVLRILAKTLRTRLRQTDFVARFGGEEFVALMPETGVDEALKTLDSIRTAIAECPFHFRSQPVSITLSAGIAVFAEGDEPDAVFERADAALYRAKQAGRNRCMVAAPEPG